MTTRRYWFNMVWIATILLYAFHPTRLTNALNNTFFAVGVGWLLLDLLDAFVKVEVMRRRAERKRKDKEKKS